MQQGDLILRNQNPAVMERAGGSFLSNLAYKGTVFFLLALLILSTVIAAADVCRAASGNHFLFNSIKLIAQFTSTYELNPIIEKERARLEKSDMDAYRNERQRWHQLKAEVKDRLASKQSKKPSKLHSTL
jgi:hypothetical protein